MAEVLVASGIRFGHRGNHLLAVETVERISLDEAGVNLFATENLFEGALDGRGTCS